MSKTLYESFGANGSLILFEHSNDGHIDHTHHSDFGGYELAKCMILGIQQNQLGLSKSVVDGFTFDPAHPDTVESFKIPRDPTIANDKPPGS
jgi:hypothetical protein